MGQWHMRSINEKGHNLSWIAFYTTCKWSQQTWEISKALRSHKVGWTNLKGDTTLVQA
jgi:hypothetical protein